MNSLVNKPLVTVIMPCFNHQDYVERAVLSALEQTYPRVELVVIDDGSTDRSLDRLQVLRKRFDFKLLFQENQGVCRTINRGIREHAHGDYIALLASDDFWHPDKLLMQLNELQRNPGSEFCFTQAIKFTDDKNPNLGKVFPSKCLSGHVVDQVFIRQHVPAGTMLFSRRLYDCLEGFDESLQEEDWDFVIRSAANTNFSSVDAPLLYYRSHQSNTMKTRSRNKIFHQKAKVLAKNFDLVSHWRWVLAINLHFFYDLIYKKYIK